MMNSDVNDTESLPSYSQCKVLKGLWMIQYIYIYISS